MGRFNDIIDIEFTANMENRLDEVEEGKRHWQDVLRDFYQGLPPGDGGSGRSPEGHPAEGAR